MLRFVDKVNLDSPRIGPDDLDLVVDAACTGAVGDIGIVAGGAGINRHGVALSEVEGTGKDGTVTKKDVQAHVSAQGGTSEDDDDESDEDDESESDEEDETEE